MIPLQAWRIPAIAVFQRLHVQLPPFELLFPVEKAACRSASEQASTHVYQQRHPAKPIQRLRQLGSGFCGVEKTVDAAYRLLGTPPPEPGSLVSRH
jgi:hypothetical protein